MVTKANTTRARSAQADAQPAGAAHSGAAAGFSFGQNPWMPDMSQMLKTLQVPGVNLEALLESRKRDLEALVEANEEVYEGMRTLAKRHTEIAQETLREWQSAVQNVGLGQPVESFAGQGEIAQQAFTKALGNLRELAELATRSQTRLLELFQKRSAENLEEIRRLMTGQ